MRGPVNDGLQRFTLEEVRAAFWKEFNESGERWFSYLGTEDANEECTKEVWDSFVEHLTGRSR